MTARENIPEIEVVRQRPSRNYPYWSLFGKCPFCGRMHRHEGHPSGAVDEDSGTLRLSHCLRYGDEPHEYRLKVVRN